MMNQNRKRMQKAGDALARELRAKAKKAELAKDVLPQDMAEDPVIIQRLFRGSRRQAKWNRRTKRRKRQ